MAAGHASLGAIGFFVADRVGAKTRSERTLTMAEAFWIGCAQAVALVPGVSRSGITITVALLIGLRRAEAARFIFLLAIPAILGAAASEAPHLLKGGRGGGDRRRSSCIGILTSAIVGYAAVKFFIRYLANALAFDVYRLADRLALGCGGRDLDRPMMQWLRRRFLAGFFVTVPLFISVAAFIWIFGVVDGLTTPLYDRLLGRRIPGLGTLSTASRSSCSSACRDQRDRQAAAAARRRVAAAGAGVPDDLRAGQAAGGGVLARQRIGVQAGRDDRGSAARVTCSGF